MSNGADTNLGMAFTGKGAGLAPVLKGKLGRFAVMGSAFLALTACDVREEYLRGEREDVRSVYSHRAAQDAVVEDGNRAEPITLPPVTRNASWLQRPGTPATRNAHAALGANPQAVWSVNIGAGDGRKGRITADPVVGGGLVYALDSEAKLTAVTAAGGVAWSQSLVPARDNPGDASGGGLAYGDGKIFAVTGFGKLTALDGKTGAILWEQDLDATGNGSPAYANGVVYLVAGDNTAWAIDASNGRIRWQLGAASDRNNVTGGPAPAIAGDSVIFAYGSGELQAASAGGGSRSWGSLVTGRREGFARAVVSDITGDPVVSGKTVYAGSHAGSMVALDLETGQQNWSAKEGPMSAVWVAGGSVFLISERNQLIRLNAADGARIWAQDLPFFVGKRPKRQAEVYAHHGPVLAGGRLVVASNDGLIRFFDPASGAASGTVAISGGATTNPVVANGTLYVVSSKGVLHAYR
jgi:outer membrane protein assembly factor BamB